MSIKKEFIAAILISATAVFGLTRCNSSGSGSERLSPVTVTGSVSSATFVGAGFNEGRVGHVAALAENGTMNLTLGNLEIYVIYFSGTVVGTVQATIDSTTGAWSFAVPNGSQINVIVRDKTTLELVGPITFVDSTNKDMSGNDKESSTFSFKTGASVGAIQLTSDGKFKVDTTIPAIAAAANTVVVPPALVVDFSGSWTLGAYAGVIPTGYSPACPVGSISCHGPTIGESIYMVKLLGKKFNYTGGNCGTYKTSAGVSGSCATTDGSVTSTNSHAAQVWGGGSAVQSCGFKLGFTAADARAFGRISINPIDLPIISGTGVSTPTPIAFGRVSFTIPAGYGTNGGDAAPNNLAWMKGGATSPYDIMDCKGLVRTGSDSKDYNLNVCSGITDPGSMSQAGFQATGPGGCVDPAGKPVVIKDWPALNSSPKTCSPVTAHPALANMKVESCSYTGISGGTASATDFTCTRTYGLFQDALATTPITYPNAYMATFNKTVAGACSTISDNLTRYRCYANAYFQDGSRSNSGCGTRFRFNWQAATTTDFVVVDGSRDKPKEQYLTSIVTYSPDGNSFTLEDEQAESVSVQSGTSSIVCRVSQKTILKGTTISDNQMLVDLTQSAILKDSTVATCVGEKNNTTANSGSGSELNRRLREGNNKFLFTLNR